MKLYRKGTVHPSPEVKADDKLFSLLLPTTILSLAAALSPEDREVLAYLISSSSSSRDRNPNSLSENTKTRKPQTEGFHPPLFYCDCFSCYTSYWLRWDSSPSRQLIHEIIDAFEDRLETKKRKKKKRSGKNDRRKRGTASVRDGGVDPACPSRISESSPRGTELSGGGVGSDSAEEQGSGGGGAAEEKGSVKRFVSFLGRSTE
ncbi:PREDICTED: uncharacterized protein LOC104823538 isoform X2 [Tarenaya hassleriana]|uniref:uncharacterized protein LOC104823538 isoform X2 n=1 Tax=Tarenaya hassleriana TaxID=28532 RepID=UPI00053C5319|nr:PREDICTED: uncharacterized protein LOC104823538 isoform X2 [Tarenaya hassleriana]